MLTEQLEEFLDFLQYEKNLSPVFICESAGTQIEDSFEMKKILSEISK